MSAHQAVFLLLDLAIVLVFTRLAGGLAERLAQPRVIGEMAAGILIGPTLFHGAISGTLFPTDVRPLLGALANLGVAVFMFFVGLELDHKRLAGNGRAALAVSLASIALPFSLGVGLAFLLRDGSPSLGFTLFIGTAMSITAFPVLARILRDRGLHRTRLGGLALTCAAADDVAAWTILAVVITATGTGTPWKLLFAVPYGLLMLFVVRPLLRRLAGREPSVGMLVAIVAGALLSGTVTEWMGLHFIFGAFLFGVVTPRAEELVRALHERVDTFATAVLLPIFFVVAGLQVDLSGLSATGLWQLGLILVAAIGGKFGGAYLGARLLGENRRSASVLAVLMNTRGLTELIVLSVGLQLHLIDVRIYSLLVVMALVTTAMAGPLLSLLRSRAAEDVFLPEAEAVAAG